MKHVLTGFAIAVLMALHGSAMGATIYVNSAWGNDTMGNGSALAPYQTIAKALTVANGGDVIDLTGTFTGEGTFIRGLTIDKNVTLRGCGAGQTFVQAAAMRGIADRPVFSIGSPKTPANVTLRNMTIRYGRRAASTSTTYAAAGGVYVNPNSQLTVEGCVIEENDIINSVGTVLGGAAGVYIDAGAQMLMSNSIVRNNNAVSDACAFGGIGMRSGTLVLRNSTVSGNSATDPNGGGDKDFTNAIGGIAILDAVVAELTNCTIAQNHSADDGGGLAVATANNMNVTDITNCTIAHNTAGDKAAGILLCQYFNAPTIRLKNTIVAENASTNETAQQDISRRLNAGSIIDNGYNIVEYTDLSLTATGNITGNQTALNLSASLELNNNPNATYTLRTMAGSVAIDAGDVVPNGSIAIPSTDQRTAARMLGTDIGAYEYYDEYGALPVELVSFEARVYEGAVRLKWNTATELMNYGFEIERRTDGVWTSIGFVPGAGNSNAPRSYSYIDPVQKGWSTVSYRLKQIDRDMSFSHSHIVDITIDRGAVVLEQNWPNPFNPSTTISFTLAEQGPVTLAVYDPSGKRIALLSDDEEYAAGTHTVLFDGAQLPSGVYFYSLHAGGIIRTRQLLLLR